MRTIQTRKNLYQADISVLAAGTELISDSCVVHEITIISDADGDASVSISDSVTSYDADSRVVKLNTTDENQMVQLIYPNGKLFATGVCATASVSSVDIAITYD